MKILCCRAIHSQKVIISSYYLEFYQSCYFITTKHHALFSIPQHDADIALATALAKTYAFSLPLDTSNRKLAMVTRAWDLFVVWAQREAFIVREIHTVQMLIIVYLQTKINFLPYAYDSHHLLGILISHTKNKNLLPWFKIRALERYPVRRVVIFSSKQFFKTRRRAWPVVIINNFFRVA